MGLGIALTRYPSACRASPGTRRPFARRLRSLALGSGLHHYASRLIAPSGRIEFTGVTDWSFTSCCSPPRLAATQLLSVTGRRTFARQGLSPYWSGTLSDALA